MFKCCDWANKLNRKYLAALPGYRLRFFHSTAHSAVAAIFYAVQKELHNFFRT